MTVSVVIPAYNAEATIARAIDSALGQTVAVNEIIVVDDGSRDGTGAIVQHYGPPVRYFRQENAGASAAKNRALAEAKGEWIAFLDADDEWLPDKMAAQLATLKARPHLVWCFCRPRLEPPGHDPDGLPRRSILHTLRKRGDLPSFLLAAATGLAIQTSGMVIRRDVLIEVGGFDETLPRGGDMDIWLRIGLHYPAVGYDPRPRHIYHRLTPGSLMKTYDSVPPGFRKLKTNLLRARSLSPEMERQMLDYARPIAFRYSIKLALGKSHVEPELRREYRRLFPLRIPQRIALLAIRFMPGALAGRFANVVRQLYRV